MSLPKLCRAGLMALVLASSPALDAAQEDRPAGFVLHAHGEAFALDADGRERALTRGNGLLKGETLLTRRGRVQVRFSDGGFAALQPNTVLKIDDYFHEPARPADDNSVLELVRGSVRFVTGLIASRNRERWRIGSVVATIGVRGSAGRADLCVDGSCPGREDGLYLVGNQDVLTLTNSRGTQDVRPGENWYVKCDECALVRVDSAPLAHVDVVTVGQEEEALESGEQRTAAGSLATFVDGTLDTGSGVAPAPEVPPRVTVPLASGSGPAAIAAAGTGSSTFTAGLLGGALTFDSAGRLVSYVDGSVPSNTFVSPTVAEFDADGIVAWGLWSAGTATGGYATQIGATIASLNYVAATTAPTGPLLANLQQTYVAFASTSPVAVSGGSVVAMGSPNTVTGVLNVDFIAASFSYTLSVPLAGQTFSVNGTAAQLGTGNGFLGQSSTITSSGSGCASSCTGIINFGDAIQGFVFGTAAERAGANYGFNTSLGKVTGAVVYQPAP